MGLCPATLPPRLPCFHGLYSTKTMAFVDAWGGLLCLGESQPLTPSYCAANGLAPVFGSLLLLLSLVSPNFSSPVTAAGSLVATVFESCSRGFQCQIRNRGRSSAARNGSRPAATQYPKHTKHAEAVLCCPRATSVHPSCHLSLHTLPNQAQHAQEHAQSKVSREIASRPCLLLAWPRLLLLGRRLAEALGTRPHGLLSKMSFGGFV